MDVVVRPSLVQGSSAPAQLADALAWFNRYHPVDVIVLTRGGGSLEDLQAFNSEAVCRAVYASRIPIICGVGHERDITLAELVADVRASTPSNAAERCVPDRREILWQLEQYAKNMEQRVGLGQQGRQLQELGQRINRILTHRLQGFNSEVAGIEQLLTSYNPKGVLKRGYAIARGSDGKVIRSTKQVKPGQAVQTEVADGSFSSQVTDKSGHIVQNGRLF